MINLSDFVNKLTKDINNISKDIDNITSEIHVNKHEEEHNDELKDISNNITQDNFIDLGLPSGLLWSRTNLGAEKPEDYGDYYAWGEVKSKASYEKANYEKVNDYNDIKLLNANDDPVISKLGDIYRMPTKEELTELIDNLRYKILFYHGVKGIKFFSLKDEDEFMFIPFAGIYLGDKLLHDGDILRLLSNECFDNNDSIALGNSINNKSEITSYRSPKKYIGCSVRAVSNKQS